MFYTELQRFVAQADLGTDRKKKDYIKQYRGFQVKVGFGRISFARIPYISFLAEGQSPSKGIYPAYLYFRNQKRLVLAYGESEEEKPVVKWSLPVGTETVKAYFARLGLDEPKRYGNSYVYKDYDLNKVKVDSSFDGDLDAILTLYATFVSSITPSAPAASAASSSTPPTSSTPTSSTSASPSPSSTPRKINRKNLIFYGPPGTGKTYNSIRYAVSIINGYDVKTIPNNSFVIDGKSIKDHFNDYQKIGQIRFTTFHQSLSYEDFIEGIKPEFDTTSAVMTYPVKAGLFKEICEAAEKDRSRNFVLIIDEINRGNVAQIFGELITLIEEDKRKDAKNAVSVTLPYSPMGPKFSVPSNLYILGTMNTVDRSVEALDSALRRRFKFIEMMPKADFAPAVITGIAKSPRDILKKINERIEVLKDSDHQIGHSFFMEVKTVEDLMEVFRFDIIPLLKEYFFGDMERIKMVIGGGFFEAKNITKKALFPDYDGGVDVPEEILQTWEDAKWEACETDPGHKDFIDAIDLLLK